MNNSSSSGTAVLSGTRLASLDFFRGLIMVLLMAESAGIYSAFDRITDHTPFHFLAVQLSHHPWHGLHFWDLIQPGFMFIAGVAMAFSLRKQTALGIAWPQQALKALKRSGWLFFWGVLDYAVRGDHLSFELWDVLTQLSFTLLLAFLIFRWRPVYQLLFTVGLLLLTECLYRFIHIPGFSQPFTDQHNFGNYVDMLLMNKINPGGWVAINCIPTAAHTIWGAVAGRLLIRPAREKSKVQALMSWGIVCLLLGYGLDVAGITPIIKRIATSSFTLASGGWCLCMLAACYARIDVYKHHRGLHFFTVVGMNSIFIYLFFEIVGDRWFNHYIETIVTGVLSPIHLPDLLVAFVAAFTIFFLEWQLCNWLYKKKIFFKA